MSYYQINKLLRALDPIGTDGLLSDFGDVNYYGYERVLLDAINLLYKNLKFLIFLLKSIIL